MEKKYPAIGSKISLLIKDSLIRYSGFLDLMEDESVVLKPVANHGTEGRNSAINQPEKEIIADLENVIPSMRFLKSDIKNIHVHNETNAASLTPSLVKHEGKIADLERKHDAEIADLKNAMAAQNDKFER